MVKHRVSHPSNPVPQSLTILIKVMGSVMFIGGLVMGGLAWLFPVEVVQSWVLERTSGDDYRKFEAIGRTEAICWLVRCAAPLMVLISVAILRHVVQLTQFTRSVLASWIRVTNFDPNDVASRSWRTLVIRAFAVVWAGLIIGHYCHATMESLTNWPYYRFRSGHDVLPNISESNRAVIRYLMQSTAPNSRIFVASDQKLYFLSYYLLPRRLYYQSHPDSEFVIPQPHLQRHMSAYSLAEIDSQTIEQIAPDYVLEYFEQPDFVDRSRLEDDEAWVKFFRQMTHDPQAEPNYLVCLRRFEKGPFR